MKNLKLNLLKTLCEIHAPSGNESAMTEFILEYVSKNKASWKVKPKVFSGDDFQNCIVLVFGKPRTAVYAHIDSIGYTVRYDNNLVRIGGPKSESGYRLSGSDSKGEISCIMTADPDSDDLKTDFNRTIEPGTDLCFECNFRSDADYVQSCYLDNRLGVWVALQLAETIKDGALVFSCWEEHGGGTASYLSGFLYRKYDIRQSLICDITWITEGVHHGKGVAVSMRDSGIPRKIFVDKVRSVLDQHKVKYQVEVESSGGSDGNEIQKSPFPIDWCFIGAPEDFVHSPDEKVHKADIKSMLEAYKILIEKL